MKYVVLSFDDGRLDTYENAVAIMQKFGITATINITSDFIMMPQNYNIFASANNLPMTVAQILDVKEKGFEIACHGHTHINDVQDILRNIETLKSWGINTKSIGFASPFSYITKSNLNRYLNILSNKIEYIRSGKQVRREGLLYSAIYFIQQTLKSSYLFYFVNKSCIVKERQRIPFYYGVSVTKHTTIQQLKHLIRKAPNESGIIFIFHSILSPNDMGYGLDNWYWDKRCFIDFCSYLSKRINVEVITNRELNARFYNVHNKNS